MTNATAETNPWQEVYEAMVVHALRGLQVVYDEFNVALEEWLNDVLNHPIPEDWREEVARFVEQTERNGLEILPDSIRVIEAIIGSSIAGADQFAQCGPAPRGPARGQAPAPLVVTVAADAGGPPAKPQPLPPLVGYPDIPVGRRGPAVNAERLFDEQLVSAKQHLAVLEQLLNAAGEKIDAAKPGEEADVDYEADMVQKHLFLYNEDLAVARDLWLRFNLSGNANSRLIAMHTPAGIGLPMFASPAQAERARQQGLAIGRRLRGDNASMDAWVTGISATDTAATAAGILAGAGALIVAAKTTGRWAVIKMVAAGAAAIAVDRLADAGLRRAGASDQTIRGVRLAAAVITLILLHRANKRSAPREPSPKPPKGTSQTPPSGPPPAGTPTPREPPGPVSPRGSTTEAQGETSQPRGDAPRSPEPSSGAPTGPAPALPQPAGGQPRLPTKPQAPGALPAQKNRASVPLSPSTPPGNYVYVQDADGVVNVVPNGPGLHPTVLGGGRPAAAAGEIVIGSNGVVTEINNISFTFQHGADVLPGVEAAVRRQGLAVAPDALKPYNH
ncbi:MAG TPA: hypothetical protein VHY91_27145 [Pirellulales bacterium]|jgi:hypothetical protein|nr:hypothetical protein [Pirellulales bacterium]